MLDYRRSHFSIFSVLIIYLFSISNLHFVELSCVESDCDNHRNSEESQRTKEKIQTQDDIPFIELMPSNQQMKLFRELSEYPFDSIFKTNPDIKSEINPNSTPLLTDMETIAKQTKQNWLKKYRDLKRTEGNRNFQTQGWK